MISELVTNRFRVKVRANFVPNQSDPELNRFLYAYRICITNEGDCAATLKRRHWIISDGFDKVEEVKGEGVVGEQPRIKPGESYEYSSCCPLNTQYGIMQGIYHMETDDGHAFQIEISPFKLYIPALAN